MARQQMDSKHPDVDYDILIVGAGLGGINCAYRFQTELPGCRYTIIEARSGVGGTWNLFKYPGIRSDSDLHTFGFEFRRWNQPQAIAEGPAILNYIEDTIQEFDIKSRIQFETTVTKANWSSAERCWTITTKHKDGTVNVSRAAFFLMASGYYDYHTPLAAQIKGLASFKGPTIHPQFWPESLDYSDKNIVVVGSGATAITLIPNLVKKAKHVTMLQRSPTYIVSLAQVDGIDRLAARFLPTSLAARFHRFKFLVFGTVVYNLCMAFPNFARRVIAKATQRQLPPNIQFDPHFKPAYNPWAQRMCIAPDGDFYKGLHTGRADVVTQHIDRVVEDGIILKNGDKLNADIIVTATGLKIHFGGHVDVSVDDKPVEMGKKHFWRNAMVQDVPNLAFVLGYVNASWTLGADVTAFLVIRLLKYLKANGLTSATPHLEPGDPMKDMPLFKLSSTYVTEATTAGTFPRAGDRAPWTARKDYWADMRDAKHGDLLLDLEVK